MSMRFTYLMCLLVAFCIVGFIRNAEIVGFPKIEQITEGSTSSISRRHVEYLFDTINKYTVEYAPFYQCPLLERAPLPKELQMTGVLDFTTYINSTDLKILVMGDSLAIQMGQLLQEAIHLTPVSNRNNNTSSERICLRYTQGLHEGITVSRTETNAVATWRITSMLLRKGEGKRLPNAGGGGWLRSDAHALLKNSTLNQIDSQHFMFATIDNSSKVFVEMEAFDVLFFRIPHPWIKSSDVTLDLLSETVELASELFGVQTIIFITAPINNDVVSPDDMLDLLEMNDRIRLFSQEFRPARQHGTSAIGGVQNVLVSDAYMLMNDLVIANARHLGYNTTDELLLYRNRTFYFSTERTGKKEGGCKIYPMSIPQGCSERVAEGTCGCRGNAFSRDGMHVCLETIGARIVANWACLMGCVYNDNEPAILSSMKQCEDICNKQYMSMKAVSTTMPLSQKN